MARSHGRQGALYVGITDNTSAPQPLLVTAKFTMKNSQDSAEVTGFGDSNKVYLVGLPDNTISFEGFWDSSVSLKAAASDGVERKFYAYIKSGSYWYGTGFISSLETDVPFDGGVAIKGEIVPAGTVTGINV